MATRLDSPRTLCVTWPIPICAGVPASGPGPAVLDRYSLYRLVRDIVALYSELLADAKNTAPRH